MITAERIDEYVKRMGEVKSALEQRGWTAVRHDEWASPLGDTVRFSYAHGEFRIYTNFINEKAEWHSVPVRPAGEAHVPTVEELLDGVMEVGRAMWSRSPVDGGCVPAPRMIE